MRGKRVRQRQWSAHDIDTVVHERRRFRGRDSGTAPLEDGPREFFTDIEPNGTVVSPYGVLAFVELEHGEVLCRVVDELVEGKTSVLAPGDCVLVEMSAEGHVVRAVAPRRNKLSRPAVGQSREQVFAANVDCLLVVASAAKPNFKPGFVDRFLIAAEVGGVAPMLCVNKMDLVEEEPDRVTLYRELGLPVFLTSCPDQRGLDALARALSGKVSCLAGQSGVGKSSIVNALDPGYEIATQDVSDANEKGRHTTSTSRLYHLSGGIDIIDTPGIRQLGLWGVTAEELDYYFPEFVDRALSCKFRDCTHLHEPLCAVKAAVEAGEIPRARYASYCRIRESL